MNTRSINDHGLIIWSRWKQKVISLHNSLTANWAQICLAHKADRIDVFPLDEIGLLYSDLWIIQLHKCTLQGKVKQKWHTDVCKQPKLLYTRNIPAYITTCSSFIMSLCIACNLLMRYICLIWVLFHKSYYHDMLSF